MLGGHVVRAPSSSGPASSRRRRRRDHGAPPCSRAPRPSNIGRLCAYTGGPPDTVPGMALDRMCASGLMTIGVAAKNILAGEMKIAMAGGVESLSLTQTKHKNTYRAQSLAVQDRC